MPGMPSNPGRPLSPFSPGDPGLPKEKTKYQNAHDLEFFFVVSEPQAQGEAPAHPPG